MNGYRWAPSNLGPALTRDTPVQVVMARSPHRCPLSYGGSSADVIQLPDMTAWAVFFKVHCKSHFFSFAFILA
jgi:hypothetical protein